MTTRRPLSLVSGQPSELPVGDLLPAGALGSGSPDSTRILYGDSVWRTVQASFVNLMPDSGRLAGRMNPLSVYASGSFTASDFFAAYNGTTTASAGKFIFDNSTNGGAQGALTQDVIDLLAAMGRTGNGARYGVEFYVASMTAGAPSDMGSSSLGADSVTRYLMTINNGRSLFGFSSISTCAMWLRVKSGSAHLGAAAYKNGSVFAAGTPLGTGWNHLRIIAGSLFGYDTAFPYLYAVQGSVVQIACAAFFNGYVDTGIHTAPLASINELST